MQSPIHENEILILALSGSFRSESFNQALIRGARELAPDHIRIDDFDPTRALPEIYPLGGPPRKPPTLWIEQVSALTLEQVFDDSIFSSSRGPDYQLRCFAEEVIPAVREVIANERALGGSLGYRFHEQIDRRLDPLGAGGTRRSVADEEPIKQNICEQRTDERAGRGIRIHSSDHTVLLRSLKQLRNVVQHSLWHRGAEEPSKVG